MARARWSTRSPMLDVVERVSQPRGGGASESCVESITVRLSRWLDDDTFMFSALNGRVRWRNVAQ
jgi:hypothetical protein